MEHIVYMARNLVNGKRYVGVTCRSLHTRITEHCKPSRAGRSALGAAIQKYGRDLFRFTKLKGCAGHEEAMAEERRLVGLWRPEYNLTEGGEGVLGRRHSADLRAKWSRERRGVSVKRRPMSAEARKHLSEIRRGKPPARPAGWKQSTEAIAKMLASKAGKSSPVAKRVLCVDDGLVHESLTAAAKFYGIWATSIGKVCAGIEYRKTGGRVFRFVDDAPLTDGA